MDRNRSLVAIFVLASSSCGAAQAAPRAATAISEAELFHRTQRIYDAVTAGDRTPWKIYFASDAMLYDEKGRAMNKSAMVADVQPLPTGYSGNISVVHPHATFAPGVAVFAYALDETETIFGQGMHARYHVVDTWLFRNGTWQIAVSQAMRYYEDPAVGRIDTTHLDDFVGRYELTPGRLRIVSREGSALFMQRGAGAKVRLLPEAGDIFFRAGVEGRIVFHRDARGKVDALIDRRNNEDIRWTALSPGTRNHPRRATGGVDGRACGLGDRT